MEYPYFAKPESDFDKKQRFCDFYMPDVEYEKLIKLFPNGCEAGWVSIYTIFYNRKTISDWIYDNTEGMSDKRIKIIDALEELKKDNQSLLWEWGDLLHLGYYPLFDGELNLACCKGKIKPNKHTIVVLLDKAPPKVSGLWKKVLTEYIIPMQNIVREMK